MPSRARTSTSARSLTSLSSVATSHSHTRTSISRSSYLRGFLAPAKKNSTSSLTSSSAQDTIIASSSNPHLHHDHHQQRPSDSPGRSPSKTFSQQKFHYTKNSMTATATVSSPSSPSSSPSPNSSSPSRSSTCGGSPGSTLKSTPGSFSKMDTASTGPLAPPSFEGPRTLGAISTTVTNSTSQSTTSSIPLPPLLQLSVVASTETDAVSSSESNANQSVSGQPSSVVPLLTQNTPPAPVSINEPVPKLTAVLAPPPLLPSPPLLTLSTPPSLSPPSSSLSLHPFSLSSLSYSTSSASSASSSSAASSPNTSPSNSPTDTCSSNPHITSPGQCDLTPYPARGVSPSELAALIERGRNTPVSQDEGDGAGIRRPLVLDLRPNPDFESLSIKDSININLPTLLMRRYRRGGAVSSFALESFITMPSDKDLYHLIQDGWRQNQDESAIHDVVVLDQDMKAGQEEYGRSAGPAWTLVSVLERGGGNLGGSIRLWYLEGGFEAFQAWDLSEKYMVRPGYEFEMDIAQDGQGQQTQDQDAEMTLAGPSENGKVHPLSMPLSLPSNSTVSSTSTMAITDAKTAQAINNAVSMTNASLGSTPRQRGAPVRRESLFSLNTKSLQRPAGLSRSQTIGVSALNIKPLSIPSMNTSLHPLQEGPGANGNGIGPLQPLPPLPNKSSWLTVPNAGGPVGPLLLSPSMSSCSSTMDMGTNSASTDHTSGWSANSSGLSATSQGKGLGETSNGFSQQQGASMLSSKKSFSSTTTLSSLHLTSSTMGIREEDEEGGEKLHRDLANDNPGFGPSDYDVNNNGNSNGVHQEHQAQMFSEGIDSYTNNSNKMSSLMSQHLQQQQQYHQGYDDAFMEEGGDNGEQEISCILPNFLYLGPEIVTEEQAQELERLGIKRVLNMARECEDVLVSNRQGIEYHKVGVLDNVEEDVSTGLLQAVGIISASMDAPIYVHCKAGKSRSVTATIAYLITQLHWSLNKAYNHVLTQRPCMCPNIGFVTELMRMEEQTLGTERAGGLVRAGSLNSILSLSTAGTGLREHHHHHNHHHSLQHTSSLSMGGSPKVLSAKSSVNNFSIMPQLQH